MELTEEEIIQNYARHRGHCLRNNLIQYEYDISCISCGYNVVKRKYKLTKLQRKK